MAVALNEHMDGKLLEMELSGKLSRNDYRQFVPEVDRQIQRCGKVRMLVRMHDFHGWGMGALWEDTKFAFRHFRDIERLAVVGERPWEHGMAVFCRPFTRARIRYFDRSKAADADAWIHEGLSAPKVEAEAASSGR